MERLTDLLKDTLQNLSGKDLTGNYVTLDELLKDFNNKYICKVTFSKTPSGATIVVKQNGVVINPDASGKYYLVAGSYTYTASAEGYVTKADQALTIAAGDVTTGTKTVTVELSVEEVTG